MRNLELVQAHSLFTFMGRMTDGPGSFLQQSIAEQSYHVMKKKFACVGVLTSSGLQQSVQAQTFTPVHTFTHRHSVKTSIKTVCFPSQPIANAKSITIAASLSVAAGQVRSFKVRLNPRGYTFPPKTEGRSWRGVVHMESVTYWLLWWSYCVPYGSV